MERKIFLAFCFVFLLFNSVLASSDTVDNNLELTAGISHITYEEPDVMEEKGLMYGIIGAFTHNDNFMLRGETRFSWGEVDYSSSSTGTLDNIDDYILEFRGLLGRNFSSSDKTTIVPYIGFGYRYLNDDSSGRLTSTGHAGYERESNYYYSPIGVELITELENGWSWGAMLEYDIFWKGVQKSHLSDANLGFSDLENDQNSGYGLRGSLKFIKKDKTMDFLIEPFITYWNIAKSKEQAVSYTGIIVGTGYEPKNNSIEIGVKSGVKF